MQPKLSEKKRFSIIARAQSFRHAIRGISVIFKTQHNAWVHALATVVAIGLGLYLNISEAEWALLVLAITSVLVAEGFNTAIEIDIDLTSPDFHPYARDTKDVAAGAVLLTVIGAVVVGLVIFLPKILVLMV
jgi:diacylglycerol kinase (ATP)